MQYAYIWRFSEAALYRGIAGQVRVQQQHGRPVGGGHPSVPTVDLGEGSTLAPVVMRR
jgi:hypothetical protein